MHPPVAPVVRSPFIDRVLRWLFLAVLVGGFASCGRQSEANADDPGTRRAFYYWRTTFKLSELEQRAIAEAGVTRLYVRLFDIASDASIAGPLTVAPGARVPAGVEVVPVVFIRHDVFQRDTVGLAASTWAEILRRLARLGVTAHEVQVDCDWTDRSRDRFFAFVTELRAAAPGIAVSATIRLHQVKYRERTGVPPVDRGMLMFYNMGQFTAEPGDKAIFDADRARRYLDRLPDYPLPLDVALPIWSWTVHTRDGQVVGLLQSTDPDELPAQDFLLAAGPDRWVATRTTFLHGELLREGDVLKVEVTAPADALAAAALVAPHLAPAPGRTISLFDLSERNLHRHGPDALHDLFHAIR